MGGASSTAAAAICRRWIRRFRPRLAPARVATGSTWAREAVGGRD